MDNDIIELQSRIAYQEDMIASLNQMLGQQQQDIQQLQQQMRALALRLKEILQEKSASGDMDISDERPPHY